MAVPLTFTPPPVDHKKELQKRLEAAPVEHGEALLVLWDLLQTAHDQGILDLLDGMVSAKDTIAITIAKYAKTPEGIASIRNLLTAVKLLGELDPEVLDNLSRVMAKASAEHEAESKPPSLWAIFRRATSAESRKALSLMTLVLQGLGRSLK
jgi:uncharacterized protein YjgD (DUF1641 family)